ncbi:hypothetical protein STEG23_002562 [Scotinomys teguina]
MVIHSSHDSIRLEFDFSDDTTNTKGSSPRRLAGLQPLQRKSEANQEQTPKEAEGRDGTREPQPASWSSYHLNWEKLDGSNFNPFGGDSKDNGKKAKFPESPKNRLALSMAEQLSAGPTDEENSPSHQLPLAPVDDIPVVQMAVGILRAEGEVQEGILNSSSTSASMSFLNGELVAPPIAPVLEPSLQGPEPIMDDKPMVPPVESVLESSNQGPEPIMDAKLMVPPVESVLESSNQGPEPIMDDKPMVPPVESVLESSNQGPEPIMDAKLMVPPVESVLESSNQGTEPIMDDKLMVPPVESVLESSNQGPEPVLDGDLAPPIEPVLEPSLQGLEPILDPKEESFRDPAEVLGTGAEVDYLEQFGMSSFKESAWRKQSLYLKFDPLLKESPVRPMPVVPVTNSIQDADESSSGNPMEAKLVDLDFLGALDVPVPGPPLCILEPRGLLPAEPIVDVLRYSQKDLDALVNATQQENLELRSKYEDLNTKYLEMGKIVDGFEKIVYKSMEEAEKQKELSEDKIKKVLKERDQLTADLNCMEKSFSDLFKRFEKQKEVIEGYRKLMTLKACYYWWSSGLATKNSFVLIQKALSP